MSKNAYTHQSVACVKSFFANELSMKTHRGKVLAAVHTGRFEAAAGSSDQVTPVVRGSPDPAPDWTAGLLQASQGNLRSAATAGSGDPRRTEAPERPAVGHSGGVRRP